MTMPHPGVIRNPRYHADDIAELFGTGGTVKILYETADANANLIKVIFPEGGAVDVPGIVFGDTSIDNVDDGWFNGLTEPFIAVANDAGDAYVRIDAGDDAVAGSKGIYFKAAADEDIELENLSVTGTPRRYWDESEDKIHSTKGWYFDEASTFDGGALDNEFLSSGVSTGIQVTNTNTGDAGARLTLYTNSANPAAQDDVGEVWFSGEDDASSKTSYGFMRCRIQDPAAATTRANMLWYVRNAGADNLAMQLTGPGILSVDDTDATTPAQVGLFDGYDDVAELQRIVQRFDKERAVELGLHIRKPDGNGYMMSFQPWMRLFAGAHYQTRETINEIKQLLQGITERLEAVEGTTKLLKEGG